MPVQLTSTTGCVHWLGVVGVERQILAGWPAPSDTSDSCQSTTELYTKSDGGGGDLCHVITGLTAATQHRRQPAPSSR
jgi:hypothetical protein